MFNRKTRGSMATKLYGLVLAGGQSSRMGTDKGLIAYHGRPHREYLYDMLLELCEDVYMSIQAEQRKDIISSYKTIADRDKYSGPFNGLQSAHESFPEVAWLVVATDLPLLGKKDLQQLIAARDPEKMATAFASRESEQPEPLCAIWEPQALKKVQDYIESEGDSSPRRFLTASNIKMVFPAEDTVLINANSREEYEEVLKKIKNG